MRADRPLLDSWRHTPWVAATPVDDRTVGDILTNEVHIGIRGSGPMSTRHLVPLSDGARRLLYGTHRDAAARVFRGILSTLDGSEGVNNVRGLSLASDEASFATNLLLSNTEAGIFRDSVGAHDPATFERDMVSLVPSVRTARAQNTGWMDIGPRVSAKIHSLIQHGAAAARNDAAEVALTVLHEAQHSVTPPNPVTIDPTGVWLEEGIAETLAWWPGRAAQVMTRMGRPPAAGDVVDRWSTPADVHASAEYEARHSAVEALLGLAGITPTRHDGSVDPHALRAATQLLQGEDVTRVPKNLARAIVREHHLPDALIDTVAQLVRDANGRPENVDALRELVTRR